MRAEKHSLPVDDKARSLAEWIGRVQLHFPMLIMPSMQPLSHCNFVPYNALGPTMDRANGDRLAFCTLGMLIIDEIDYGDGRCKVENILGGAGTYAALGARLAAGQHNARLVSWIVDRGSDFPDELMSVIDSWQTSCVFRTNANRLTTRAWNGYGENQHRAFKYLTLKQRLEEPDLNDDQVMASAFHMVCSPLRCVQLCRGISERRLKLDSQSPHPITIWEPVPDLCTPEELGNLRIAAQHVEVVSPNGEEFASFFKGQYPRPDRKSMVEQVLGRALDSGHLHPAFVIREGAEGCYLFFQDMQVHFPAYHQSGDRVVDPTGGGNTFLGALTIGMAGTVSPNSDIIGSLKWDITVHPSLSALMRVLCAVVHATIAASFAIEQVGMPTVQQENPDMWNGQSYMKRFYGYLDRELAYLTHQLNQGVSLEDG